MPLYDYACEDCGRESELLIHADRQPSCPECGSAKMNRLLPLVASPTRETSAGGRPESPPGPCGSACGCHPH